MTIGEIQLSYPYIQYNVSVIHFTSRKSTAIEWMILELLSQFGHDASYEPIPLDTIFKGILKISDSDLLIKPCLIALHDLDAIASSLLSDNIPLSEVPLRDVRLTENGANMQKLGLLPGEDRDDIIKLYFDVRQNKLYDTSIKAFKEYAGVKAVDVDEDTVVFPYSLISDFITDSRDKRSAKYQWLQPSTQIKDILMNGMEINWRNVIKEILVTGDGYVSLEGLTPSDDEQALLFTDESSTYLGKSFNYDLIASEYIEDFDLCYESVFFSALLPEKIDNLQAQLIFADAIFFYPDYPVYEKKALSNIILFNGNDFNLIIDKKRIKLTLPDAMPLTNAVLLTDKDNFFALRSTLYNDFGNASFCLAAVKRNVNFNVSDAIQEIIKNYIHDDYRVALLIGLVGGFKDIEDIFHDYLQTLDSLDEKEAVMDEMQQLYQSLFNKKPDFEKMTYKILIQDVLADKRFSDKTQLEDTVSAIMNSRFIKKSNGLYTAFMQTMLCHIEGVESIESLWDIWKYIVSIKKDNAAVIMSAAPVSDIYTNALLFSLYNYINAPDDFKITAYTSVEKIFLEFRNAAGDIGNLLSVNIFEQTLSEEQSRLLIIDNKSAIEKINNLLSRWKENRINLGKQSLDYGTLFSDIPPLHSAEQSVNALAEAAAVFYDDVTHKYDKVYVIDTSAIMNNPELLSTFSEKLRELLIIPTVVINELDGLKESEDENTAFSARQAIRAINNHMAMSYIKSMNAYPELLPVDLNEPTPDNLIISIVIKYIVKQPIIITDDINMSNKALSQNITAKGSEEYLAAHKEQQRLPSKANKTARNAVNQKKKKKKKQGVAQNEQFA